MDAARDEVRAEEALDVWLAHLGGHPAGTTEEFDELCARHPHLIAHLEALKKCGSEELGDTSVSARLDPLSRLVELSRPLERGARYVREAPIARGGMGTIYRVRDVELNRTLALKEMSAGSAPEHQLAAARFLEEAQITAQLDHPGIVPVHELGVDRDGRLFFTMKLVDGRDLREILEQVREGLGGWSQTRVIDVLVRVCEAMAYAHSRGVVHRDLKPGNVMVGHFGEVYVMDWGLARALGRDNVREIRERSGVEHASVHTERREERAESPDSPFVTLDGVVLGTPSYMPPEQARGALDELSPRWDVYAVGAMLYELLSGTPPYQPSAGRVGKHTVLARVIEGPPPAVASLNATAAPELVAICERAMARDPAHRYRDTLALAGDLRAHLEHRVVHAHRTGAWAELSKWVERNRALASAAAVAVLALVGGLVTSTTWYVEAKENEGLATRHATEAGEQAERAEKGEHEARENARRANDRTQEVLRLSALQELDDLVSEADHLWPPLPEFVPLYDDWLRRARAVEREHAAKLVELRQAARVETEAERERSRRAHFRFAELESIRARLASLAALERQEIPADDLGAEVWHRGLSSEQLVARAWPFVHPERSVLGQEGRGLALAQLAVERAEDDAALLGALGVQAWAQFACGRRAEARALLDEHEALQRSDGSLRSRSMPGELRAALTHADQGLRSPLTTLLNNRSRQIEEEIAAAEEPVYLTDDDRWWAKQLERLVERLTALDDPRTGLISGQSPTQGMGIMARLELARRIRELSLDGELARERWAAAIASIADADECPAYAGLAIVPQLGLLPLGRDPESGLWEFAHLFTGTAPERDASGRLVLTPEIGVVLVLMPGGEGRRGAQDDDPGGPNYDPETVRRSERSCSPVHRIWLSPFFLSKFEMTRAQWQRVFGSDPGSSYASAIESRFPRGARLDVSLLPVEQVNWEESRRWLQRVGLELPSEAQWEYSARGDTDTPWWTGTDERSITGAANLLDSSASRRGNASPDGAELWLDDGFPVQAPIGSYRANRYGLHDVIGNVCEWCLDNPVHYVESSEIDRIGFALETDLRVARGGSFETPAENASSAMRAPVSPTLRDPSFGVRPARALEP